MHAHHDEQGGRLLCLCPAQDIDAAHAGKHDVDQREVGLVLCQSGERLLRGSREHNFVALAVQGTAQGAQGQRLLIRNEDGVGAATPRIQTVSGHRASLITLAQISGSGSDSSHVRG